MAAGAPALKMRIVTSSNVVPPHGPLFTVQRKVFVPIPRDVIVVVGDVGFVIVPEPAVNVHVPVAGKINELPAMVAVVFGVHFC